MGVNQISMDGGSLFVGKSKSGKTSMALPGGSAAKGHSARQLRRTMLNLRLAAEHIHKGLQLCGGSWAEAVSFYAGAWPCTAGPWGTKVAGAAERVAAEHNRGRRS